MKKKMTTKMAAIFSVCAMTMSSIAGLGAIQVKGAEKDIYSMTKDDLEGRKITITSAEDWWHPPYQTLVDMYQEEFGVKIEVNILPADTASEVIKSQFSTGELADITMNSSSPMELTYMRADEMLADMSEEPWVKNLNDTSGFEYSDGKLYGIPLASQDYWGFC